MTINRIIVVLFVISLLFFLTLTSLIFFPFETCINYPLIKYDFSYHFTNAVNSVQYTFSHLSAWGYNPMQEAGYTEGHGLSTRILIPFMVLFHSFPPHIIFNIFTWLAIIAVPCSFAFAAGLFASGRNIKKIAFCYICFYLFGSKIGHEFIYVGHFGFLLSMSFSLVAMGYLKKFSDERKKSFLLLQGIFAGLSIWTHPFAVVFLIPFYIFIGVTFRFKFQEVVSFIIICITTTIGPNLFWVFGFIRYLIGRHHWGSMGQYLQTNTNDIIQHLLMEPFVVVLIIAIAVGHCLKIKKDYDKYLGLIIVMVIMSIIGVSGSQLYLFDFQPLRFVIPAMMSVIMLVLLFKNNTFHVIIIVMLIPIAIFKVLTMDYRITTGCGFSNKEISQMFLFIEKIIKPHNQRIHIQDSLGTPFNNTRISSLIPYYTDVPTVALPMPFPVTFPTFVDNVLFGKKLDDLSQQEFYKYTDLYNIGFFIVHSNEAKNYFKKHLNAEEIFRNSIATIFKIDLKWPSYCYQCDANITLKGRYLFVNNIVGREITLKYHRKRAISAIEQDVVVEERIIGDDPIPFIKLKTAGHSSIILRLDP